MNKGKVTITSNLVKHSVRLGREGVMYDSDKVQKNLSKEERIKQLQAELAKLQQ
jgi:hypothetical protein